MTRRAHIEERQLEALCTRCADVGVRLILKVDLAGEATVCVGGERFGVWTDAVAHVADLESSARVEA